MWTALSAAPASSTGAGRSMMIGWATPTVAPLAGLIFGGGGPAGGTTTPGSPGGGSGSASAGPAVSTSAQPNTVAIPATFRAPNILPLVLVDICASLRSRSRDSLAQLADGAYLAAGCAPARTKVAEGNWKPRFRDERGFYV